MDLPEMLIQCLFNYQKNKDNVKLLIDNIQELKSYRNKDV
jgi:hypothetical protein